MNANRDNVALDDETLDSVNGAGLKDALGRIGESVKTDLDKGIEIGSYGGKLGLGVGASVGATIGLVKGIKNEIF
ncbi:hypothetical protein AB4Z10_05020 [Bosea sp. RAF48]|jgi:hypothetical protein|uniref:hypothetical protein n=1 Tax=Bosea sp. RAF48 TaxID=3237480 RepID=UPI003F91D320